MVETEPVSILTAPSPAALVATGLSSITQPSSTTRRGTKRAAAEVALESQAKRSKNPKRTWRVCSGNITSWASGGKALFEGFGNGLAPDLPDILALQEHRLNLPDKRKEAEDWSRNWGLHLSVAPAQRTGPRPLETSGGVAAGARSHIGSAQQEIDSFREFPGRLQAILLNAILPGGVVLLNCYCRDGFDAKMLEVMGAYIATCAQPWLIAADWNHTPEVLARSQWLLQVRGRVVAPQTPTCTAGQGNVIDFFVVSERLAPYVQAIEVAVGAPTTPHHPVTLILEAAARTALYTMRVSRKPFPAKAPIGCEREPRQYSWSWPAGTQPPDLSQAWAEWLSRAEIYLCDRFDITGKERQAYVGRASGFRLVERSLDTRIQRASYRSVSEEAQAWASLRALASQALDLKRRSEAGEGLAR